MRALLVVSLLVLALCSCHKDAEQRSHTEDAAAVAKAIGTPGDATAVDVAVAVSPADVPSPVTP